MVTWVTIVLVTIDIVVDVTTTGGATLPSQILADTVMVSRTLDVSVSLVVCVAVVRTIVVSVQRPHVLSQPVPTQAVVVAVCQRVAVRVTRHMVSVLVTVNVDPYAVLVSQSVEHRSLSHEPKAAWHPTPQYAISLPQKPCSEQH